MTPEDISPHDKRLIAEETSLRPILCVDGETFHLNATQDCGKTDINRGFSLFKFCSECTNTQQPNDRMRGFVGLRYNMAQHNKIDARESSLERRYAIEAVNSLQAIIMNLASVNAYAMFFCNLPVYMYISSVYKLSR